MTVVDDDIYISCTIFYDTFHQSIKQASRDEYKNNVCIMNSIIKVIVQNLQNPPPELI